VKGEGDVDGFDDVDGLCGAVSCPLAANCPPCCRENVEKLFEPIGPMDDVRDVEVDVDVDVDVDVVGGRVRIVVLLRV